MALVDERRSSGPPTPTRTISARLGHTAHEIVVDCAPLQEAWAREHGQDGSDRESTLLAQVAEFEPDVVYVQNLHVLSVETMRALRRPGRLVAGQIASAAPPVERLRMYDVIFTSFPHFVEHFRSAGVDTEYFRIGFDERVLEELGEVRAEHETVFVGALNGLRHRRGNRVLAAAAKRVDRLLGLRPARLGTVVADPAPVPRRVMGDRHVPPSGLVPDGSQQAHLRCRRSCEQHAAL